MKKLWITLPAFSPDYSGVCSALYELGGISIIHDASGCTGNYTGYDEPRWYNEQSFVFCSGLREIDAVLGQDDKLIDDILYAIKDLSPTMIAILGSPVPMLIGSDMDGIAHELEERSGLPTFGFNTNGLRLYNSGVSETIVRLVERFAKDDEEKDPVGVNILGMTPIDFGNGSNATDFVQLLEEEGFHVYGKLMMGASLQQLEQVAKASVNLVVTESGFSAAKKMQEYWNIPYVVALALGDGKDTMNLLRQTLLDQQNRVMREPAEEGGILIVAEQVLGNALRHAILKHDSSQKVTVATMFGLNRALASEGDLDLPDEHSLRSILRKGNFHTLVGDPLFEELITPAAPMNFVPFPHLAVSSKLFWNEFPVFLHSDMDQKVDCIIQKQEYTI